METGQRFNPRAMLRGSWIPEAIERHPELTPAAKLVYARLLRYSGKNGRAYPKQETLAAVLGCGIRTIRRGISQLEKLGFIEIEKANPLSHRPNAYYFIFNACFDQSVPAGHNDLHGEAKMAGPGRSLWPVQGDAKMAGPIQESHIRESDTREGAAHAGSGPLKTFLKVMNKKHGQDVSGDARWIGFSRSDINELLRRGINADRIIAALEWYNDNEFWTVIDSGRKLVTHFAALEKAIKDSNANTTTESGDYNFHD